MTNRKQKLELSWIGKDKRPRLEARILLENTDVSYHAKRRISENDLFDNRLIFGDNLLALKALEQEFSGKIKCIYIDPPFNTQQALEYYDDGIEHSLWLSLLRDRLEILRNLLAEDGSLFVHIDDNELGYLLVLLDDIFGRSNKISVITFKQGAAVGHKAINPGIVNTSNFIVWYAKNKAEWKPNKVFTGRERDKRYGQFIANRNEDFSKWRFMPLAKAFAESLNLSAEDQRRVKKLYPDYEELLDEFVLKNADSVVQLVRPDAEKVSAAARALIEQSLASPAKVFRLEREEHSDFYLIGGQRIIFYSGKLKLIDGEYVAGEPLTSIWDDLLSNNLHKEGGVDFPKSKKPEALIKRVLDLSTSKGDWVLDSFAGSGTTGAVAHKMGRKWIMVELREHCDTHILPRLKSVIDGSDSSGITKAENWSGGGGFRYFTLAPSLLSKDSWGNWVISKEYNAPMLAEAMCKQMGFVYAPSDSYSFIHGYSSERDFIYVTTASLTYEQLKMISDEVGEERSLLICCGAFKADADAFANLNIVKIPQAVLNRCEWGRDDYSFRIANLEMDVASMPESRQLSLLNPR